MGNERRVIVIAERTKKPTAKKRSRKKSKLRKLLEDVPEDELYGDISLEEAQRATSGNSDEEDKIRTLRQINFKKKLN